MATPHLSIAMCTYNGERYLPEQLESIAVQTRLPDELIVCDDRSTDGSVEIIRSFAHHAPFPICLEINASNLGSTKNFEKAIELCRGDIIALADQDDIWYSNKLERIEVIFADGASVGVVFSDAEIVDENRVALGYRLWRSAAFSPARQRDLSNGRGTQVLLNHNVVTGATMAFRSKFKDLVLPIPENWVHDGWIALLISVFADLAVIHDPLVQYRRHAGQQIGPVSHSIPERIARAKRTGEDEYFALAQQYGAARERLCAAGDDPRIQAVIPQIEMKIKHLQGRAKVAAGGVVCLPRILEELLSLRYHRYSNGWKSAAKDLLFTAE
jgi:glycosyltransferase involved in cell wall biosynthesis